ncbi:MAG: bifunctional hydroxymethylpyrimidine kinase/phosphomethylpyrimidine kinase [Methanomicrobiaceae archaeon]|nr:bifunctional hydroxymethylpyrimidine kinase/phosphomethylpyrimidine kinase [Methanomicrobiaceae archaeon]
MNGNILSFACTIAGSDSGGGAGIQADLKTFAAMGVWGCSVITAVTAQNTREVRGSWVLPPEAVTCQIEAVVSDFPIRAFKTGMLAHEGIIRAVAGALPPEGALVIDPVMIATSGARLLAEDAVDALVACLLPRAALVTPNIPEAQVLAGMDAIGSVDEMITAGRRICARGASAVLVTGGHLTGEESVDVLVEGGRVTRFSGERYPGQVHGTGCCLSAAITASLARDRTIAEACGDARSFVAGAIREAVVSSGGRRIVHPRPARQGL